jgi:predicted nucleotidyltransferase
LAFFEFVRRRRQLAEIVGQSVDLATPVALRPQLRDRILHEAAVCWAADR